MLGVDIMIATMGLTVKALKKEPFSGSHHGMRYYLNTSDDTLNVWIYPEPWCFEQTPEEDKTFTPFHNKFPNPRSGTLAPAPANS